MASLDHKDEGGSLNYNLKAQNEHHVDDDHRSISRQKQSCCSSSLSDSSVKSIVLENNENGIADTCGFKHGGDNEPSAFSYSSDFANPSPVWSYQSTSTPQCPPTQMMARPAYDTNRIPLSMFSSRPTNSMAWSHTSNESLFSIQVGNDSFSRDHFVLGNKVAESRRFDESVSKSMAQHPVEEVVPSNYANNDIEEHSDSGSTRVSQEDTNDSSLLMHCESVKTLAESATIVSNDTPEDNSKEAMTPREEAKNIISASYGSQDSRISSHSFQFHLLPIPCGRKSKITTKSENHEEDKPLEPPSAKSEKAPNSRPRNRWYFPSCCGSL